MLNWHHTAFGMDFISPAYRYFVEVAESRSIREAADRIRISQSAVSRQIIKLEQLAGYTLFERNPRGVSLTVEGELLLRCLRESAQLSAQLQSQIDRVRGVQRGRLRVAVVEAFSANALPDVLRRFQELHPAVTLRVMVEDSAVIREGLLEEAYDVGVIFNPRSDELLIHETFETPLHALVAPTHRLSGEPDVSLKTIKAYPIIAPSHVGGSREIFLAAERHIKSGFRVVLETNSANVAAAALRRSDAVGILSPLSAARYIETGLLVAVPIREDIVASGKLAVASKLGRNLPPAADILVSMLSNAMRRLGQVSRG